MKKSTILILLVVYLGSILIVGIFGMKAIPFEQLIYCQKITPTSVTTTSGRELEIKEMRDKDSGKHEFYYVIIPREESQDLEILINYMVTPSDSTNKGVKITIVEPKDPPATVTERGSIVITEKRSVHLVYKAEDSATGPQMDFWIYFR